MGRKTCIKCGKGVRVLVCKSSNCPVTVHEGCIPGSLPLHGRENFCCPYCLYKQSVAECQQAKEKALLAQRKLSIFLGTKTSANKEFEPNVTRDKRTTLQNHEHFGNQERLGKGKEKWHSLRTENDPKGGECSLVHVRGMSSDEGSASSEIDKKIDYLRNCEGSLKGARYINGIKMVEKQKSCDGQIYGMLRHKVEGGVVTANFMRACKKRTANIEYLTPMPLSVVGGEQVGFHLPIQNHVYHNEIFAEDQQHLDRFYYRNMEKDMQSEPSLCSLWKEGEELGKVAETDLLKTKWQGEAGPYETVTCSMSNTRAEIYEQSNSRSETYISRNYRTDMYAGLARQSIQSKLESKNFNQPGEVSHKPPGDDAYRCNDLDIVPSSNAGRIDKPSNTILNGVAYNPRRKRLRWTTEEEEILKNGIIKFSTGVKKYLPWRKILEFGHHVFDGSRTPSELKSKWKIISGKEHLESNEE